jgi:protease-4
MFFILVFTAVVSVSMVLFALVISSSFKAPKITQGEKVGVIELTGVIADSKQILEDLKRFREDRSIKSIVLRIDSPGGGVGPSQEIFRAILKTKKQKKIIASMGSLAASGGYYAAAATDGIVANPGTITGSIGVIMGYTNFKSIMDKIGLVPVVIKSGDFKDTGSPAREMRPEEKIFLQNFVDKIHSQFVNDVAMGRNMEVETVAKLADGRIYTGQDAMELKLVDRLGNFEDAIDWAGKLAGIKGEPSIVYPPRSPLSFIDYLSESAMENLYNAIYNAPVSAGFLYRPAN